MALSAIDSISPAFEHAKQQLFKPFRYGQWWRLATVGFLAGELGSGGGCNTSNFNSLRPGQHTQHFMDPGLSGTNPAAWIGLIIVLAVSAFVLGILFMYVSSVMRFVLFDSILKKDCHIRAGWRARQGEGWKLFVWKVLYSLVMLLAMGVIVGVPSLIALASGWWKDPKEHIGGWVLLGLPTVAAFLIFILLSAVVYVLTKDFVVPQMAFEDIGVMEGWRRLWEKIRAEKGSYAGYIGMKILLAIGAGIVVAIATFVLVLVMVIPVAGALIAGHAAGMGWTVGTITAAVVVGVVLLTAMMFVVSMISVPAIVFFPAYSMYYFAGRYERLGAVLWPAAAAVLTPPPMGLPPSAEPIG